MKFENKVYDVLKWICLIVLPAIASCYFVVAKIWKLPYAEEIIGTISAVDTLIGAMIGISTKNFTGDGKIVLFGSETDENGEEVATIGFEFNEATDLAEKNSVVMVVSEEVKNFIRGEGVEEKVIETTD